MAVDRGGQKEKNPSMNIMKEKLSLNPRPVDFYSFDLSGSQYEEEVGDISDLLLHEADKFRLSIRYDGLWRLSIIGMK